MNPATMAEAMEELQRVIRVFGRTAAAHLVAHHPVRRVVVMYAAAALVRSYTG